MWKDAAQGAVIQDGGERAVCRNDAPGPAIWAHSYTAEPSQEKPTPLCSHEPQAAAPGGLSGESMCSRASSIGTSHTWQRMLLGV